MQCTLQVGYYGEQHRHRNIGFFRCINGGAAVAYNGQEFLERFLFVGRQGLPK